MTLPKNVAELQGENVLFELECIDRMYLNLYVPQLASAPGVAAYFRGYKGHRFASTKEAVAMSEGFRRQVLDFAERKATPIIRFEKGMRKDDIMHKRLRKFKAREGVVFIGIAQEKARVPRTIRKGFGEAEGAIPWIDYTTAMVNHYYFYCVDEDFGPFFIKFCSYFPYTGKLCINGHEYLNGQLARRGIEFEALDNEIRLCAPCRRRNPKLMHVAPARPFIAPCLDFAQTFQPPQRIAGFPDTLAESPKIALPLRQQCVAFPCNCVTIVAYGSACAPPR